MSLVSNLFIIFVAGAVLLYYLLPKKMRWWGLLLTSYIYYLAAGTKYFPFLLFSTIITYLCGLAIEHGVNQDKKKAKRYLIIGLILNFGMLGVIKYTNFILENINLAFHLELPGMQILLPLGISFYTFQTSGYLLDIYWKRDHAEKNIFRYALFVSYFPQILQGPIGRHSRLAEQLYEGHSFDLQRICRGIQRILWGFFKKMILADWSAVFVDAIFGNPDQYNGLAIFGVLFYSIQLYADFSGGMDVVIGISEMFGIVLDENFKRPYFSTSITDFWHRWHITLGTWMKDYVFYPLTLSQGMVKFRKAAKKKLGKKISVKLPICVSNLIVFFLVGVWHGAAWKYIAYGMFNGIIIAFSGMMGDQYKKWKKSLHVTGKEKWYHIFMIVRTFILVNISWFFDCSDTVGQAIRMMKNAVTSFSPGQLLLIPAGREGVAFTPYALVILFVGSMILFTVSLLQERGVKIRETIAKRNFAVQFLIYAGLVLCIGFFGSTAAVRGFIYAQF